MSAGSAFGFVLLALALGAGVLLLDAADVPTMLILLLLTPVLAAGVLLSARRHRP